MRKERCVDLRGRDKQATGYAEKNGIEGRLVG